MLPLNVTLSYYKRPEIRKALVEQCANKEVAIIFGGDRFGKRPQMIIYDSDVLSFAQKKATSFHLSEESWSNPMQLQPGMRVKDLNALRIAWDLVLDVDFPEWEATKIITNALVEQLKKENIPEEAITAKFSGNKGFHIGIPYEAFPETFVDMDGTEKLLVDIFPDGARRIVEYLVNEIDGPKNGYALSERLVQMNLEGMKERLIPVCEECGQKTDTVSVEGNEFVCPNCDYRDKNEQEYMTCPKCRQLLTPIRVEKARKCSCGSTKFRKKVDLAIDTMLVTSRHMYRAVYSLHEKSGLASVPVNPNKILSFDKEAAKPENVTTTIPFMNRSVPQDCANDLLVKSLTFRPPDAETRKTFEEVEWEGDAAPEEVFPPAIKKMLAGLRDGKKRALFVLTNFLKSVGWSYEMIEARLDKWNEANEEPLRETNLRGHLRYHKQKKEAVLPPNFDNDMYYKDLGVLEHDELSRRVKNPVQYVRLRLKQSGSEAPSK